MVFIRKHLSKGKFYYSVVETLAVLAFGLRSLLELKLRKNNLHVTVEEALQQLAKVRVLCSNGRIIRLTGEDDTTKQIAQILSKKG